MSDSIGGRSGRPRRRTWRYLGVGLLGVAVLCGLGGWAASAGRPPFRGAKGDTQPPFRGAKGDNLTGCAAQVSNSDTHGTHLHK